MPSLDSIIAYLNKYYDDFPDPGVDWDGMQVEMAFRELCLDEQIYILKTIVEKNPQAIRAYKLLGSRYFWSLDERYVDSAIYCLTKYVEREKQRSPDSSFEILGGLYLLKNQESKAMQYFKMSNRLDIAFVLRAYGAMKTYTDLQRHNNVGLRFRDFSCGKFPDGYLAIC